MKNGIAILLLNSLFLCNVLGQNAPKIQKAYAFYTMYIPGMAMADEKGNTINPTPVIDRFIYVESPGTNMPDIRSVLYNNVLFKAAITKLSENELHIGKKEDGGREILLKTKKGNSFWKLDVQLASDTDKMPKEAKHIVIQGRYNKHLYSFVLNNETRLMTPDRY